MTALNWDSLISEIFTLAPIKNFVKADKLFVRFLIEIERRRIDIVRQFTVAEIADLIPIGTAGIWIDGTYGYSLMSMFSGQKGRDYFVFDKPGLRDEFTAICNTNLNRNNYYWKKHYSNEKVRINPKYIKLKGHVL